MAARFDSSDEICELFLRLWSKLLRLSMASDIAIQRGKNRASELLA
jgi:hypothetical protein